MKTLRVKWSALVLLLWSWLDRYECLTDSSLSGIFFPFGPDEGDSVLRPGSYYSDKPINIPYQIFNNRRIYVSLACAKLRKTV